MNAAPHIVFDTDPGADDALALLWLCALHARGRIVLRQLTTVGGNVSASDTFINAERLLRLCGLPDLALARGADRSGKHATHVHGQDGLAGLRPRLPAPKRAYADAPDAADVLARPWPLRDGGATLVAVGPLTNLARAVQRDAQSLQRIPRIVVMGGALGAGNITAHAEFNVYHDPESWAQALDHGRLEIVPLEQTHRVYLALNDADGIDLPGPIGSFARELIRRMCVDGAKRTGKQQFFLHDAAAVAAACYPQTVRFRPAALQVTLEGEQRGAVREVSGNPPNARVADELDPAAIRRVLLDDLSWFAHRQPTPV